ncbi:spore coat putative kinase YutH [Ferdinandcohnia quinoae]|uniref:Spore coat protein YutH n=1 Tax=Fredinandcohnia quinoae TaxID=2918902 RepID=A0AAW5DYU3_9BACI|nr:spore coat protein YutH [Fredinandcohnia sp. SECRCQ15]MCH1625538.1 spore coat protein YutH [Fredinandcohnia sp. SECRCQ15]
MKEALYENYNLRIDKTINFFGFEGFFYRNILYCIVPNSNLELEEIFELKQMSDYLIQNGDIRVASILPTTSGQLISTINEQNSIVVRCPVHDRRTSESIGKELARFHKKGRSFPYRVTRLSRIGQWKYLWEKRLDQMEMFWKEKVRQHPENSFERLFVEAFPYYIGLTENAIQYLVDTELDEYPAPIDSATICHHRFTEMTWDKNYFFKLPTDWVYDHYTRDIAEYIRDQHSIGETKINNQIYHFMNDYERVSPLSPFSWRLLYARLLFPLHFFECIEGYYLVSSEEKMKREEQRLTTIINDSSDHERFLSNFFNQVGVQKRKLNLPDVSWLAR